MTDQERWDREKAIGGRAFPTNGYGDGMSLRDWFAGQALAGLLAFSPEGCDSSGNFGFRAAAKEAYWYADAMLARRTECPEPAPTQAAEKK
jgi:hypothetical protein